MLLSLENTHTHTERKQTTTKQTKTAAAYSSPCLHHR